MQNMGVSLLSVEFVCPTVPKIFVVEIFVFQNISSVEYYDG